MNELDVPYDEGRLEKELAYLIQISDVEEELDRLSIHVVKTKRVLKKGGSVVLMTVELKVLIEQMREQIQNLE